MPWMPLDIAASLWLWAWNPLMPQLSAQAVPTVGHPESKMAERSRDTPIPKLPGYSVGQPVSWGGRRGWAQALSHDDIGR